MSPTNFRLDRERRFYCEFCVVKLVFLSFRQYLVEIESNYKLCLIFLYIRFLRMQCCARVSASKFQALIRSGSRDTTCRWFTVFLLSSYEMGIVCDVHKLLPMCSEHVSIYYSTHARSV